MIRRSNNLGKKKDGAASADVYGVVDVDAVVLDLDAVVLDLDAVVNFDAAVDDAVVLDLDAGCLY